jgi:hypothetical protein
MKPAAIGVRMHSGWGALVAVSETSGTVEILARRRISVSAPGASGPNQPYHAAKDLKPAEAEQFLLTCFAAAKRLALSAVREVVAELRDRQYKVVGSAVLLASGRPLPPLAKILAAHPLMHKAEGEFFRRVITKAYEDVDLSVTGIRERDLEQCVQTTFGKTWTRIRKQIDAAGRTLGPPWTQDQKLAAFSALVVLANKK